MTLSKQLNHLMVLIIFVLMGGIMSCGGGGGTGGDVAQNSPSISNLRFSPTTIETGQTSNVEGTLDFVDNDGNLSTLTVVGSDKSLQTSNISGLAGQKVGTMMGIVQLQASELGKLTFQVFVTDTQGHRSNELSGIINVAPSGSMSTGTINGKIYIRAGSYFVEYNPINSLWTKKNFMPDVQPGIGLGVIGTRIYAIGESRTDFYEQLSDQWLSGIPLSVPRHGTSVCVFNNKIYVFGGATTNPLNSLDVPTNVVEQYDPVSNLWTTKTAMPTARSGSVAVTVNNRIFVINGAVDAYDPITDTWTSKSPPPSGSMTGMNASAVNSKIYLFDANKNVQEYDTLTDRWAMKNTMPAASFNMRSETIDGKIYVIGSMGIYEYDPSMDQWRQAS